MNPTIVSNRLSRLAAFVVVIATTGILCGQEDFDRGGLDRVGIGLLDPTTERWEMGLVVTGGAGAARGVIATAPVPIDWPEQKVTVIREDKTANVRRITYKVLNDSVKQMSISIPRLAAGEMARATVIIEVEKSWIEGPPDVSRFRFAETLPRDVRRHLAPSPYIESRHSRIRELADQLFDDERDAWTQIHSLYEWVRENVEYRFDTRIKSCVDALNDGVGDCEELSSIFIAICRARGIPARAVWIPGHTYPEFYVEDDEGNGHWIPCQAAGMEEFGAMSENKPILQKGDRFKIHGHRELMRYVQPTLTAADAEAPPMVEWIMEKVEK